MAPHDKFVIYDQLYLFYEKDEVINSTTIETIGRIMDHPAKPTPTAAAALTSTTPRV